MFRSKIIICILAITIINIYSKSEQEVALNTSQNSNASFVRHFILVNHEKNPFKDGEMNTEFNQFYSQLEKCPRFIPYLKKLHLLILHNLFTYLSKIYTTFNITHPGNFSAEYHSSTEDILKSYLELEQNYGLTTKTLIINHLMDLVEIQTNKFMRDLFPNLDKSIATSAGKILMKHDYGADLTFMMKEVEELLFDTLNITKEEFNKLKNVMNKNILPKYINESFLNSLKNAGIILKKKTDPSGAITSFKLKTIGKELDSKTKSELIDLINLNYTYKLNMGKNKPPKTIVENLFTKTIKNIFQSSIYKKINIPQSILFITNPSISGEKQFNTISNTIVYLKNLTSAINYLINLTSGKIQNPGISSDNMQLLKNLLKNKILPKYSNLNLKNYGININKTENKLFEINIKSQKVEDDLINKVNSMRNLLKNYFFSENAELKNILIPFQNKPKTIKNHQDLIEAIRDLNFSINFILNTLHQIPKNKESFSDVQNEYLKTLAAYLKFFKKYTDTLAEQTTMGTNKFVKHAEDLFNKLYKNTKHDDSGISENDIIPSIDRTKSIKTQKKYKNVIEYIKSSHQPQLFFYNKDLLRILKILPNLIKLLPKNAKNVPLPQNLVNDAKILAPMKNNINIPKAFFIGENGKITSNPKTFNSMFISIATPDPKNPIYVQELISQPDWMNSPDGIIKVLKAILGDFSAAAELNILDPCIACIIEKALKPNSIPKVCSQCSFFQKKENQLANINLMPSLN